MAILTKGHTFADGDQVTSTKLNNLVELSTFAAGAVDAVTLLLDGGGYLKVGVIQTGNIAASAVTTAKIADSTGASDGITTAKLATSAVTTAKIADAAVTTAKMSLGSGTFPIQMQQAVKNDIQTVTGHATAWTEITGLSLTLTRLNTAATGKVRVQAVIAHASNSTNYGMAFRLVRASTTIAVPGTAGSRVLATVAGAQYEGLYGQSCASIDFIDDHDLTSATIAYKVEGRIVSGAVGYINRGYTDADVSDYVYRTISTLTLTELA